VNQNFERSDSERQKSKLRKGYYLNLRLKP